MQDDKDYILAIDQGTTSSRAIAFTLDGKPLAIEQAEFTQIFHRPGWVEHNPEEIWETTVKTARAAIEKMAADGWHPATAGITNQRETTVIWDRKTGAAVYNAIVWQDRRTASLCRKLQEKGYEKTVAEKTGLRLDPYFSATKIAWILENESDLKSRAKKGELAFGTIDSFLLWRLTGGVHATDVTNASRTLLLDIKKQAWSAELCNLFNIPKQLLPEVRENAGEFGATLKDVLGAEIPINGMAGDQQAASIGQGCFSPGSVKSTFGTGSFMMQNTGDEPVKSQHRLLSTIACQIDGAVSYALEGSIFIAGAAIQWLRDSLGIVKTAEATQQLAEQLTSNHGVYFVPALTGLGAPHWDPDARGLITGLTRDTGPAHLSRAALEAVAYQTLDLLSATARDGVGEPDEIKIDGGMARNDWFAQFLADITGKSVARPKVTETTALGAAFLAGLGAGIYRNTGDFKHLWALDRLFEPKMAGADRQAHIEGWQRALAQCLSSRPLKA